MTRECIGAGEIWSKDRNSFLSPDFSLEKMDKRNQGERKCGSSNANRINRTGASSSRFPRNDGVFRKASERSPGQDVHGRGCRKRQPLFPRHCKTMFAASRHPMSRWHSAPDADSGHRCGGDRRKNAVTRSKHGSSASIAVAAN